MSMLSLYSGALILQCLGFSFILELYYYNVYAFALFWSFNITISKLSLYSGAILLQCLGFHFCLEL